MRLSPSIILASLALTAVAYAPLSPAGDKPAAAGDPAHGQQVYSHECTGCHAVNETVIGPKHCGVFGRRAGSVPGYPYSDVMKEAGFVWDAKHLDEFLQSPISYLSGTNMGYAGLDSSKDRADVIAFLRKGMNPANCALTASQLPPPPNTQANGKQTEEHAGQQQQQPGAGCSGSSCTR